MIDPGVLSFPVSNFRLFFSLGAPFPRFCREGPGRSFWPGVQQSVSSERVSICAVPPETIFLDTLNKFYTRFPTSFFFSDWRGEIAARVQLVQLPNFLRQSRFFRHHLSTVDLEYEILVILSEICEVQKLFCKKVPRDSFEYF